jgi:hypothetical protein
MGIRERENHGLLATYPHCSNRIVSPNLIVGKFCSGSGAGRRGTCLPLSDEAKAATLSLDPAIVMAIKNRKRISFVSIFFFQTMNMNDYLLPTFKQNTVGVPCLMSIRTISDLESYSTVQ